MKKIILLIVFILLNSCGKEFNREEIISKYDKTDFSFFKETTIFDRYGVYMIYKNNLPLYAVDYSHTLNTIIKVRKPIEFDEDYLTENQIEQIIKEFRKFEFNFLSVDENQNVKFHISSGKCTHFFLKKNPDSELTEKNYQKINENWFYDVRCAE
ncbi:MAG: hypothetical protein QM564_02620 [Bergeyella sp.]